VDETGQPVPGADVTIGYYVAPPTNQSIALATKRGKTDTNGLFAASERSRSVDLLFGAVKEGYYKTDLAYELGAPYQYDPVKWSPVITLVLKGVINPIPMYAKGIDKGPPVSNEPVGFDLTVGDWTAPHGKGQARDIIFNKNYSLKSTSDYESKLTLSFPNPGDGIQEFQRDALGQGSDLRSPHDAPVDGYRSQLLRETSAHPGQPSKFDYDEKRIYFFRVRTVMDDEGNVKSALYGKIYGDFMQFRYYLNPTPNSRNIEFDPKQNLLKNLKSTEQVEAP
jgi:hypothetical protein